MIRGGMVVGLTKVDVEAYYGWDGDCPGCDLDAKRISSIARRAGVDNILLRNEQATRENFANAFTDVSSKLMPEDLFFAYYSGHGGQVPDLNGDEVDGKDETLCLWNGELVDDDIALLIKKIPAGVRCFIITDCCNSGSNLRARTRRPSTPLNITRAVPPTFNNQLIHFAGCGDGRYSYGSELGGVFTNALLKTYRRGITYKKWFKRARAMMPRNQVPVYTEYGAVVDEFRNAGVFA